MTFPLLKILYSMTLLKIPIYGIISKWHWKWSDRSYYHKWYWQWYLNLQILVTENLLSWNNNFFGLNTFSYVLSDGIDTSIEYMGIFDVAAINDAPVMDEIEDQIIDEDTFLEYILNTQDVENDNIVYSAT